MNPFYCQKIESATWKIGKTDDTSMKELEVASFAILNIASVKIQLPDFCPPQFINTCVFPR